PLASFRSIPTHCVDLPAAGRRETLQAAWGIGLALTVTVGWEIYEWLHARRYPHETVAESYLKNRLGEMTSDQERVVRHAVDHDFLLAMLVATSAQNGGQSPWDALGQIAKQSPTPVLAVQKQALSAGVEGKIRKDDAAPFVDSLLAVRTLLNDHAARE